MTTLTVGNYKLLITLNATDVIVRAEHQTNKRLYESTFTADDFPGCDVYGGLEAVGRIILSAFKGADGASCRLDHERGDALDYCVNVGGLVPIKYALRLFAKRREPKTQVVEDVEELRAECAALKAEVKALQTAATAAAATTPAAIILPGCPVPIPTYCTQLTLTNKIIKADIPTSICPGKHCDLEHIKNAGYNPSYGQYTITCKNSPGGMHTIPTKEFMNLWTIQPYDFINNKYTCYNIYNIKELKHMKHLHTLYLQTNQNLDGSAIGELINLKKLELNCGALRDIDWITKLIRLEELNLEGCSMITDVSMCKSLINLTKLNIKGTGVRNTEMLTSSRLAIEK